MQKKVIQEIRDDYSLDKNSKRTLDGYAASIKTLADDLYAKDTHFIFELIQNAEDNAYKKDKPTLRFILTKADPVGGDSDTIVLIVGNNETGFQKEHVEAICSVGSSTKKKDLGYIGEKGIGFKSVFKATSCPYIYSNGFQFSLPEKDDLSGLGYIVPNWIETISPKKINDFTTIFLPLDKPEFPVGKVVKSLKDIAPETIVFLKKLKTIELSVTVEEQYEIIIEKDDSEFPLVKLTYFKKDAGKENITEQLFWVSSKEFDKPEDINHEKRANIATRDVSIAIPLEKNQLGKLFAYLPVWEDTGLPFLINADFLLASSREAVKEDEPWNDWLRGCIAEVYMDTLTSCLASEKLTFAQKISSYASLPQRTNHPFLQPVVPAIQERLKTSACIYVAHCDELAVPSTTRIANKDFWDLIGEGDLPESLKKTTQLVCSELAPYSKNLKTIGVSSLKNDDLLECLEDDNWLSSDSDNEWLIQLYRFLGTRKFEKKSLFPKNLVKVWSDKDQCPILSNEGHCPIYFKREQKAREATKGAPKWLRKMVPTVFLDQSFLNTVKEQGDAIEIQAWMTESLNVHPFSITNYCIDIKKVLRENCGVLSPKNIATVTNFLVMHAGNDFGWNGIDVVLNNGKQVGLSLWGSDIIVPEDYDQESGWQHIWKDEEDRQHFDVMSKYYDFDTVNYLLKKCQRIKKFPKPKQVNNIYGFKTDNSTDVANSYEKVCISNCMQHSTSAKNISNWRPPSSLNQETIEHRKVSNSLVAYLSSVDVSDYRTAYVHYFYYSSKKVSVQSEFYSRLKNCKWLPTQKGFVRPSQAFLSRNEIREILGDTVPYFQGELSEKNIELLGIKSELAIDELLETLTAYCSETHVYKEMVYRIYSALDTRTGFDYSGNISELFANNQWIFVPEKKDEGNWYSLKQVIWEDSGNVLGDDVAYLEKHYPKLKDFFINTLGVKEKADPESFANCWLKLQYDNEKSSREIRENIESIYRTLLPIARETESEKPSWWNELVRGALIFTQKGEFHDSCFIVVPDDGELKKIFSGDESLVEFAWRPEKDSFSQWAPFYKAFDIPNISNSVTTKLITDTEHVICENNLFLTESTILMLSSWLREKDNKLYEKLLEKGVFQDLHDLCEAKTNEEIGILFILDAGILSEEVEKNYPVFWDQQNNILIIDKQSKQSVIKRRISTEIAKGLMGNRAYKDLSHWIELTLCADSIERVQDEGWSVPKEITQLFKRKFQQFETTESKEEGETRKDSDDINQLVDKRINSTPNESKQLNTDNSQKDSSDIANTSCINKKKKEDGSVDEKEEKDNTDDSQFDIADEENSEVSKADHEDQDIQNETVQDNDILEKFEQAFNKDGEISLSEEYEEDEYYNDGTVKNSSRRRDRSKAGHRKRIKNEPNQDERRRETTRTILEPADPATRAYLLNMYTGKCQICGNTFPQRNGSPFFVVGHIVERKNARLLDDPANAFCLCPEHFAQWRHGKVEADDIIEQILSKQTNSAGDDDLSLKVTLCGKNCEIRYKEKHILDLQAFLETISEI